MDNWFETERNRFSLTKRYAYLNHASRGPLSPPAHALILEMAEDLLTVHPDQSVSMHGEFQEARQAMADLIGADLRCIGLIPNTSSGLAMAAGSLPIAAGDNVILSRGEFPANIYPWLNLKSRGVEIRMLDRGPQGITADQVRQAIDDRTRVVALSWVGFCDGARIDTAALAQLCHEHDVHFVVDAIQGVGALQVDLTGIDMLVSGSGKWTLSVQGGGFVYVQPDLVEKLEPDRVGWLSMACNADLAQFESLTEYPFELAKDVRRVETGSNSLIAQRSLGASCAYLHGLGIERIEARIFSLCDYLIEGLKRKGLSPVTPLREGLRSGIVCFPMPDAAGLAKTLIEEDVIVSAREGNIRVGIHFYNNEEDLDRLLERI